MSMTVRALPVASGSVLFLVFNRPDTTAQVFEAIRKAKPARLYVAADGPRQAHAADLRRVAEVRRIATAVDWPCTLKTLFRVENLGCKNAVGSAISWFFDHEEQGIVLEDDCLPHPDFFPFCEQLLERYKDDPRVSAITGDNFQHGRWRGKASYYFSRYNHVWGWASWRRAWMGYDVSLRFWPPWKHSKDWRRRLPDRVERRYWEDIFDRMYAQEIDTWDYVWTNCVWRNGGLTATPNVNLVTNIGFGPEATHTSSASRVTDAPSQPLGKLIHPKRVKQHRRADRYVFDHHFAGIRLRPHWKILRLLKSVRRRLNTRMQPEGIVR